MESADIKRINSAFNEQARLVRDLTQLVNTLQTQLVQQSQQIQRQESRLNQLLATVFDGGPTSGNNN